MSPLPITMRQPRVDDARSIHRICEESGVLDVNSVYAYALLSKEFGESGVVAENARHEVIGFVTAFIPPTRGDTWFVWQVGVDAQHRGQGIASKMLRWALRDPGLRHIRWLETTIGPSNQASDRLFRSVAKRLHASVETSTYLQSTQLNAGHEAEILYRIGPFPEAFYEYL